MITDPWFYVLAVPAVFVVGISKGGFGAGLGILAVPLMALRMPPTQAAGILLPILCLMDLVGITAYRRQWDKRNMLYMLPGALVGIFGGGYLLAYMNDSVIKLLLGFLALGFTLYRIAISRIQLPASGASFWRGSFWGFVSGFTSLVAHAGGPPASVYLLPQRLDKTVFVATTAVFFALVNYLKLIPYASIGQLDATNLWTALILSPLAPLGVWAGMWLHLRLPERIFYALCYLLLAGTGSNLIYEGLQGLHVIGH